MRKAYNSILHFYTLTLLHFYKFTSLQCHININGICNKNSPHFGRARHIVHFYIYAFVFLQVYTYSVTVKHSNNFTLSQCKRKTALCLALQKSVWMRKACSSLIKDHRSQSSATIYWVRKPAVSLVCL